MNFYVALGGAALAVAGVAGVFFYGVEVGQDRELARQKRAEDVATAAVAARDLQVGDLLSKIEVKNVEVTQPVIREVRTRTVYAECKHTPDGLRAVNNAITGRAEPAGGGVVPPAKPARP